MPKEPTIFDRIAGVRDELGTTSFDSSASRGGNIFERLSEEQAPPSPSLMDRAKSYGKAALDVISTPASKALGGATATEAYEMAGRSAKQVAERALGEPWEVTREKLPGAKTAEWLYRGGKVIPGMLDFIQSPTGAAAAAGVPMLPAPAQAAVGAGFSAMQSQDAYEQAKAGKYPEAVATAASAALPLAHSYGATRQARATERSMEKPKTEPILPPPPAGVTQRTDLTAKPSSLEARQRAELTSLEPEIPPPPPLEAMKQAPPAREVRQQELESAFLNEPPKSAAESAQPWLPPAPEMPAPYTAMRQVGLPDTMAEMKQAPPERVARQAEVEAAFSELPPPKSAAESAAVLDDRTARERFNLPEPELPPPTWQEQQEVRLRTPLPPEPPAPIPIEDVVGATEERLPPPPPQPSSKKPVSPRRKATQSGSLTIDPQTIAAIREKGLAVETALLDRLAPLRHMTEGKGLKPGEDPYVMGRNFSGYWGRIQNRLSDLADILPTQSFKEYFTLSKPSLLKDALNYMEMERHVELGTRPDLAGTYKIPGGRDVAGVQGEMAAFAAKAGPQRMAEVAKLADGIRTWKNNILTEAKDAGLISEAAHNAILAKNEKYLPFDRLEYVADLAGQMEHGSGSMSVSAADIIRPIKGSEKKIADPLDALIRQTVKTEGLIARNKVAQAIGNLAADPNFAGTVIELKGGGPAPRGMEKISAFYDGKKRDFAVPKTVGEAVKGMNKESVDLATKWASKSSAMLRAGATSLNIPFIPTNAIRDYRTARVVSRVGFTPADWMRGFAESMLPGKDYREYLESGAGFSGFFESNKPVRRTARDLTKPGWAKVGETVVNPFSLMKYLGEHIEMAPRLGVYKRSRRMGNAPEQAGIDSRNSTVDFNKAGTLVKLVNLWVPFLNARTQGTANMLGAVSPMKMATGEGRTQLRRSMWGLTTTVGIPALATYLYNTRNHREVWDDIDPQVKQNYYLMIYGDAKDSKGNYTQVVKFPKGDSQVFSNPFENFLAYVDGRDSQTLDQLAFQTLSDVSPVQFERRGQFSPALVASGALPPAAKALVEGGMNKNLYTGREIVPSRGRLGDMTKTSPEQQYYPDTPMAYRWAGENLGVSPLKIENAAKTMLGGLPAEVTNPEDIPASVGRRFGSARGGAYEESIINRVRKIETEVADKDIQSARKAVEIYGSLMNLPEDQRADQFESLVQSDAIDDNVAKRLLAAFERDSKNMSPSEKVMRSMNTEVRARFAMDELNRIQDPDERLKKFDDWTEKGILSGQVVKKMAALAQ